ncbi:MAG: hypothetical protein A2513_02275 [Sulfurimonas sp. RIFOXYD12_FULL_33_39]|uniref:AAA family ATPase n=1 Tax=unclassified Sulfurimonas TaxID=2623549 RepID=UPI0008BAAD87|nr:MULTISPECIES: AAA family ATPase [unclassified Sulfurimonas]OHE08833.1 MAG: hypothetical protein A2513_02275 [Sulfurimonas sp. RIFOXYD12_FULL_33_39]OHE14143.1 MAG: hypothetical protein A2530_05575 [Sulfurimonas sp. RIFOXYD2_FULL_34_21]
MKLIKFSAENVYGYLKFDITFNNDLSFLVGGNGSGKTTVLKLIQAILTPNLKDIYLIPYEKMALEFEKDNKKYTIFIEKTKIKISIFLDGNHEEKLTLDNIHDQDELAYILSREEKSIDFFNKKLFEQKTNHIFKFIHEIEVPLFLGLERRENNRDEDHFFHEKILLRNSGKGIIRHNRYIDGSLGQSLQETQEIVKNVYEKIRRKEDFQRKKLRDDILLTSFNFANFGDLLDSNGDFKTMNIDEQFNITTKKEAIANALKNIGFDRDKNLKEMEDFFLKIEGLFSEMKNSDTKGVNIAWLINKSQIDRILKLIELIDESNAKVEKSYETINKFIDTVNHFLGDTKKSIEVDNIGNLKIKKPNGQYATIDALSSGERQLIVMFSHLVFKNESNPSGVFIIDEPELSLHLKWQEEFVQYALESSPKTQLILATHSPEIFAGYENKVIQVKGI